MNQNVRERIFGEGQKAALKDLKPTDCPYGGEKRSVWLAGYHSVDEGDE